MQKTISKSVELNYACGSSHLSRQIQNNRQLLLLVNIAKQLTSSLIPFSDLGRHAEVVRNTSHLRDWRALNLPNVTLSSRLMDHELYARRVRLTPRVHPFSGSIMHAHCVLSILVPLSLQRIVASHEIRQVDSRNLLRASNRQHS
ncbi:hypothetical protein ABKN59_004297 [Abortiporus biennis]